ncbi:tudor domain-containing protein 6 [Mastacembelus armatus]|uniref:tudor domain-containing protein 6 n=1 Tax=Mastacembelus armatus TaxID=205130 RepID=UPI000E45B49C|nr:tudor domain-containing protein 6-like [Mastacembelus armatus]
MCSIPGLPTPGSEVGFLITRVNLSPSCGLVELWVNMDDRKKHIYEQLTEEIQTPLRKFYGCEGNQGDLCLVCITGTWHRARIVLTESETYSVFLIDQGQPHVSTSEALAWGHSDSFLLPPETECCILANVLSLENNWPERAATFLKSLCGKKFKGVVQHVLMPDRTILLDIPTLSAHVCKSGFAKKIPGDEFKCLVLKHLQLPKGEASETCYITQEQNLNVSCQLKKDDQYFYPELLTDTFEMVNVTEVTRPHNIFCKLQIFSKAVKILSEQIHQHYEQSSDFGEAQPQAYGDPCAARGENGRWHRSSLKQNIVTNDGDVEVLHVDEGKTELVPVRDIKPLHSQFLRMPVVTYRCCLNGVKDNGTGWTTDQTDYLKSLLLNQTVMAKFDYHSISEDAYYVTVYGCNSHFTEKAEIFPSSKTEQDSNIQKKHTPTSCVSSVGEEEHLDLQNQVTTNVDELQVETLPSTKNLAVNGRTDDANISSANIYINGSSEHSAASLKTGLKCTLTSDEEDLLHNMVDSEMPSDSLCKRLAQDCAQTEAHVQIPPQVSSDAYKYCTYNIEVGGKEKVLATFSENVAHFYCQLNRNFHLLDKVMKNVKQLMGQPQSTDHPLGLNSICFARYTDDQWYRGQIVEMFPKLKVHFVDYGDTLVVNESDIVPLTSEASIARSVPVLAIPLGLYEVPGDVPQEVNEWFVDNTTGHSFSMFVVAKGTNRKLIVELFNGPLNVNAQVRERISAMTQQNMTGLVQQPDQLFSNCTEQVTVANEDYLTQYKAHSNNGVCARDELNMSSQSITACSPEIEHEKSLDEGTQSASDVVLKNKKRALAKTLIQGSHSGSEVHLSLCMYMWPNICQNKTEDIYASCIAGPHYFWCQYTNTELLNNLSKHAQEAAKTQLDMVFSDTLDSGSPCLALFSSDNQWYRAQVIQRAGDTLHVLFIDYGNESDVDIKNVRSLPQNLLEMAPQAFLCSLNGFDESKGSWDDQVYDDFYNLLVDKPLRVTVLNTKDHAETGLPQYVVQVECENVIINSLMDKYWNPFSTEHAETELAKLEAFPQYGHTELNMTHLNVGKRHVNTCVYKTPNISKNETVEVYASCIAEPNYFWCQYANTEDLRKVSALAQESGWSQQDMIFPETLGPGSPCLALFSSDNQWYRAQTIRRDEDAIYVVFIDYGNESDVDIKNVRSLPQNLLDMAPQSFLCSLNGFDESKGSWDDQVYDDFYNLLVDKPLRVAVLNMKDHAETGLPQYAVQVECEGVVVNRLMAKYWKPVATEHVMTESPQMENSFQGGQIEPSMKDVNVSKGNANTCVYEKQKMSIKQMECVYASCIAEPSFFWCQYSNTEDLSKVSVLAQEAGQSKQDTMFAHTLRPGSPCLALFSSDNQWYRAQVIQRAGDTLHVLFIDYGNESDVDIKNVRSLPQNLLEMAPQAFLCSLNGFDESKGSWDDQVYDDFYNLLVDKPLRVTVLNTKDHAETGLPQYAVQVECEGVVVNRLMEKYWKGVDTEDLVSG